MQRKSVTANKKLRCLQRKNPLLFSVKIFQYSVVLILIYLFNYPEVSACRIYFLFQKNIYKKKTWIAGWPHARFCGSLFIGPPGEGEGAATRKIYRVFLRTGEGQSPGEGRGEKKRSWWCTFFAGGMRKMAYGRPHTLHKWCAACVYET